MVKYKCPYCGVISSSRVVVRGYIKVTHLGRTAKPLKVVGGSLDSQLRRFVSRGGRFS